MEFTYGQTMPRPYMNVQSSFTDASVMIRGMVYWSVVVTLLMAAIVFLARQQLF